MNNIIKVIKYAKPYHIYFLVIALIIILTTALELVSPYILKLIVDQIEMQVTSGTGDISRLYFLIGILVASGTLAALFEAVNQRIGDYTTARMGKFLTEKFYRKIFTLPQRYFDTQISGKILSLLSRGIVSLQDFLGAATNFIIPAFLRSIFIIVVLAFYSWPIALFTMLVFPFYVLVSHFSTKKWGEFQIKKNQIEDVTRGRIQEVITNIRLVKSYNTQKKEWTFVSDNMEKSVKIYDKQSLTYHILNFFRNFGLEVGLFIVSIIVFRNTFIGVLSLGEMVLILQYLNQIRRPLFAMSFILERMKQAETGSKEYFEVLELESTETLSDKIKKPVFDHPSITFDHVSFEYPESGLVLKDVSFTLPGKETVALVGHSGAGKTTLINLILKFYEPTEGQILMEKSSYKDMSHQEVRSHISLVFQENELFSTTIFDNVAYGRTDAKEKDVISALKKANAYDFVMKFPKGIHAEIGERGVRLSGGQKQRIQIARAILADAPILILDEATSSLDAKSERLVQEALEKLMKNRLVIIIAHRFSTIQNADRIMVLDQGRIVDSGAPGDLAKRKGVYSELLRYQIEGNKKLLEKYELS
ncbi:ABC transporter ATP-binding protein [Candidatus Roizmanbacteria bacterium]|nr:MAG: ABC transporter ATP-binding protein [Candidatus Roizmanbacteria bacterium]